VVVHGGPGAPGSAAPLARELADGFRVLEPWQRRSGGEPLTVACHVADLHALIASRCRGERPAIVGHSWGAMLGLAYAAAHPGEGSPLVLVGCGTFDAAARARLRAIREARMDGEFRQAMARLDRVYPDPDERLGAAGQLMARLDSYDAAPGNASEDLGKAACDARGHEETWHDMLRLQEEGVYPAAFSAIRSPVLMLHGAADPHPGRMIRASLAPHVRQLEYREWARCGHYPWRERFVRDEFFAVLRAWLVGHQLETHTEER
jgi:pimeloyl-ACP methyl ester carboxylesterase